MQGCIRWAVCETEPNPYYRLPDQWKALGKPPRYLKVAGSPAPEPGGREETGAIDSGNAVGRGVSTSDCQ